MMCDVIQSLVFLTEKLAFSKKTVVRFIISLILFLKNFIISFILFLKQSHLFKERRRKQEIQWQP